MCNTATIQNLVSSDLINVTTGILTGTTGVSGKLNISFNGNYIYIENRFMVNFVNLCIQIFFIRDYFPSVILCPLTYVSSSRLLVDLS